MADSAQRIQDVFFTDALVLMHYERAQVAALLALQESGTCKQ